MNTLPEWEKEWKAMFFLHECTVTPQMKAEWESEKKHLLKKIVISESTLIFINLHSICCDLYIPNREKLFPYPAFSMDDPVNFELLRDLTYPADLVLSFQAELAGYDLLMSLKPADRKDWWMKYQIRLKDKNGNYFYYVISIDVHCFDMRKVPWLLKWEYHRLPETYVPGKIPYRVFSHPLSREIKEMYKITVGKVKKLNERERKVLLCSHEGLSCLKTADKLNLIYKQVKYAREQIFKKTHTHTIDQAYQYALKHKMI